MQDWRGGRRCNTCGKNLRTGKSRNFKYKACTSCGVFLYKKGLLRALSVFSKEFVRNAPQQWTITHAGPVLSVFRREPDGSWVLFRDANMLAAVE
jgi:hypothetical protein